MINILYCIPALYNPGGMERILTEKINYLSENGKYRIFVVTTDQNNKTPFFKLNDSITIFNLDLKFDSLLNLNIFQKYFQIKKILKKYKELLEKLIEENNIDICISTGGKELEFLSDMDVNCKKILEIHFAKNFRYQYLLSRNNSFLNKIIGKIRTWQLLEQTKKLDAVVVLTKADAVDWRKTHNNIHQIYNFSDNLNNYQINYDNKKVIAVGKLDAQKGFDRLIDIWTLVDKDINGWELLIFGQGEWREILEKKIKNQKFNNKVYLKGVSQNIEREMCLSSVYVCTSRYEGFPMVLLEAISNGLAIISFDCEHGPSEIIDNNGILVEQNNLLKFAQAIEKICTDDILRKKMGENSVIKSKEFSKDKIMLYWIELFDKIIAK